MNRQNDAFSAFHPAVNFAFFVGAIGLGVVIQHPAYIAAGCICAAAYYLLLHGRRGIRFLLSLLPLFLFLSAINPLFNTGGERVLFRIFGRPYTLEALLFGMAVSGIFLNMTLWFGCYNAVMTGDKFICLFGSRIPSLSLLLVMVLRMVPNLIQKASQIAGARAAIGKAGGDTASEKLTGGMTVLSALTSLALEGSVTTADSMRSRGYGCTRRSSFQIYKLRIRDISVLTVMVFLLAAVIVCAARGAVAAAFTPALSIAPISGRFLPGFAAYVIYLLIPCALYLREAVLWRYLRSRI